MPDRSGDAGGKYMIYILITAGGNADMLDEEICILLAHEITHAYNDYMTRNAGKINPIQCGRADGTVLHKNYMNPDQIIRYMHDIIYFSLKSETDAMQSEIFMEMSRKKRIHVRPEQHRSCHVGHGGDEKDKKNSGRAVIH